MKKVTFIMLFALIGMMGAWANVPFETTTLTDGEFAVGTRWYTIKIGSAGYVLSDNEDAEYISLSNTKTDRSAADLWCFVSDDSLDAYYVYNKQAGATKVLAAPVEMSGTTGADSHPVLMEKDSLTDDYVALWVFEASDDLGDDVNGQYMYELGYEDNKVNNRDNTLAFWTGGEDAGSTLLIEFGEVTLQVALTDEAGTFTSSNSAGTWSSVWTSASDDPQLTLNSSYNNMTDDDDYEGCIIAYQGSQVDDQDYTLATDAEYLITSFTYAFKQYGSANTITVGDVEYTASDEYQTITVDSVYESSTVAFNISGGNSGYGIVLDEFYVTIQPSDEEEEEQVEVFVYDNVTNTIVYRIPALATAYNGDLVAVADYRYSGSDIGSGRLDLHYRISHDNGATWDDTQTVIEGYYNSSSDYWGYGDPAIVADRESSRMLLLSCEGDVLYSSGTRSHHQGIARFYSEDNGATWTYDTDISEDIYTMFDESSIGTPVSMFVGSGRIFQSSTVKVGDYYRLYCAVLYKDENSVAKNYVLYSDDFGENWSVLGGVDAPGITSGADEPKTEELPDGSIVVSSRITGGRYYNIYTFTNSETAEGSWGTMATSNSDNDGVVASGNSCNGEIMIVPARRLSDGVGVYVVLQSVPFGSGRANVGIYYKEIESLAEYLTPEDFAANWDGKHQASTMSSAYSTMSLLQDGTIGFLYEEATYGYSYTIIYKNYTLEDITDSLYSYDSSVSRDSIVIRGIDEKYATIEDYIGLYVGNLKESSEEAITEAYETYVASPSKDNYEAMNLALASGEQIEIEEGYMYRLRNSSRGDADYYLYYDNDESELAASNTLDADDEYGLWVFEPDEDEGDDAYYVRNEGSSKYISKSPAVYSSFSVTSRARYSYTVTSSLDGLSSLACTNPTNSSYPAIHLDSSYDLVPWTTTAGASLWYIEPTGELTGIASVTLESEEGEEVYYDLLGRRVANPTKGIYVNGDHKKVYVK